MSTTEQLFLDKKYKLLTVAHEMRMSHWVYSPVIINLLTQQVVINLEGSNWDLRSARGGENSIFLKLSRYPDSTKEYEIEIDTSKNIAAINNSLYSFNKVLEALENIAQ